MKRRNTYRNRTSSSSDNRSSFFSWSDFVITAIAALALAAGLFFAASQHFRSMEFGIKNAKLRSQLIDLENEKRRLELSRAVALAPSELKKNAKALGFRASSEIVATVARPEVADAQSGSSAEVAGLENETGFETVVTKAGADAHSKRPEAKTVADTPHRAVSPKPSQKPAKADVSSRPRIVEASAQPSKADPRKLVKKTIMSRMANRTSAEKLK